MREPAHELPAVRDLDLSRRLLAGLVEAESGCWEWQGHVDRTGYGRIKVEGRVQRVHRIAYAIFHGTIPFAMTAHHTCHNRRCCRPDHLTLMTHSENARDGINHRHHARSKVPGSTGPGDSEREDLRVVG